jgi:hypothetical protein
VAFAQAAARRRVFRMQTISAGAPPGHVDMAGLAGQEQANGLATAVGVGWGAGHGSGLLHLDASKGCLVAEPIQQGLPVQPEEPRSCAGASDDS